MLQSAQRVEEESIEYCIRSYKNRSKFIKYLKTILPKSKSMNKIIFEILRTHKAHKAFLKEEFGWHKKIKNFKWD